MISRAAAHLGHNVVAYVALFIALGGTAYAVVPDLNSVESEHIVNGEVKRADIRRNAVNAQRVRDIPRSVPIPLGSFADCEGFPATGRDLDWSDDADTNSDRQISSSGDQVIQWDDVTADNDDSHTVCSEIMVPPDAVEDLGVRVSASKQQELGATVEQITANISGHSRTIDMANGTTETLYEIETDRTVTSGEALTVSITVHGPFGAVIDDSVNVHGVDFVYRAKQ